MLKFKMLILSFTERAADDIFVKTSEILKNSGIIAYPTESFYALGAAAADEHAVRKLFKLKDRPADKPLPVIVGDPEILKSMVKDIPARAQKLIGQFWPGPLTLIFEAKEDIPVLLTGGTGRVAARIPGESVALYLARALKIPITSTSANPSGKPPARDVAAVINYFGNAIDLIIDGGKAPGGEPSTIVDVTAAPPCVLRKGRLAIP